MINHPKELTQEQLDRIVDIWLSSNVEAHSFTAKEYWESNLEEVRGLLPQSDLSFFETNYEILGFMGIMDNYIAGIFIDQKFRGRGIGKKLLDDAKLKHTTLELSVYKENELAVKFYLREDFKIIEELRETETNEVEYLMKWEK